MKELNELMKPSTHGVVYCDLDGVLVNMLGEVSKLYNIPDLNDNNFDTYLAKFKDDLDSNNPHFFLDLPWKADGKKLWSFISKYNAHILSSAPRRWQPNAMEDKKKWVKNNLGLVGSKVVVVRGSDQKKQYAVSGEKKNILIDDYEKNIVEWRNAGGIGIHHTNTETTISQLKKLGY